MKQGKTLNIKPILDSMDLVYYEYDSQNQIIKVKDNCPKNYIQRELTKITYYLASKNIVFDVLHNKSILIGTKDSVILKLKRAFQF